MDEMEVDVNHSANRGRLDKMARSGNLLVSQPDKIIQSHWRRSNKWMVKVQQWDISEIRSATFDSRSS